MPESPGLERSRPHSNCQNSVTLFGCVETCVTLASNGEKVLWGRLAFQVSRMKRFFELPLGPPTEPDSSCSQNV